MSKTRNLSDLLDANGDVKSTALDNVPSPTLTGIDDNADAVAITIDSSENVLVGKTTIAGAFNTVGTELRANGLVQSTVDGSKCFDANRKTSDGDIIGFSKNGSAVGSIGTTNGDLDIGTGDTGIQFNDNANQLLPYNTSTRTTVDATIGLGGSTRRFTNLYLSGSVYLGGITSANALDDYEEGEYQPTISVPSGSITLNTSFDTLRYTKIGRMVNVSGQIRVSSVSSPSGTPVTVSVPFANLDGTELSERTAGVFQIYALGSIASDVVIHIVGSESSFRLQKLVSGTHNNIDGSEFSGDEELEFNLTYFTNS